MIENCKNCWFVNNCTEKESTKDVCVKYEHMLSMFKSSNLKIPFWSKANLFLTNDPEVRKIYTLSKSMEEFYNNNKNILIWSDKFMNGKTSWVVRMIQNYMTTWVNLQFTDYPCCYYINASDIVENFKNQVEDKDKYDDMLFFMKSTELLVIDDIDILIGKEKVAEVVGNILNERYSNNLSSLFTSHESPAILKTKIQNKYFVNKVVEVSEIYEFTVSKEEIDEMKRLEGEN